MIKTRLLGCKAGAGSAARGLPLGSFLESEAAFLLSLQPPRLDDVADQPGRANHRDWEALAHVVLKAGAATGSINGCGYAWLPP